MRFRVLDNPPNPYHTAEREWLVPPPESRLEVFAEEARSILTENDSPDLPFRWSVNPYRGCQHACAYCYARPYHEFLDWGAGTDFDTKLVVRQNAPELLRKALAKPTWQRESLTFSGVTDCYQPIEASFGITRKCLAVCEEFANPVAVVTKGALVRRDADLLARIHKRASAAVFISTTFADPEMSTLIEPQAPSPAQRFETIRHLTEAGVPVGVMVAPIIPGLNDREVARILEKAAQAGAIAATCTAVRLSGSVRPVFLSRIKEALPARAKRIEARIRDIRSGNLSNPNFGERMKGDGPYWDSIMELFHKTRERVGLASEIPERPLPPIPTKPNDQFTFDWADADVT
jgi:DNA repair photolyase